MASSKRWILVVDDDKQAAQSLADHLVSHGFAVLTAASIARATQLLANQRFHCILVDMFLGSERGSKLIHQLRRDKKNFNSESPVLAISGSFDPAVISEIRQLVSGALVKPFRPSEVVQQIKRLCDALDSIGEPGRAAA